MEPRGELFAPISCCRLFTSSVLCERGIVVHAKKYLKVKKIPVDNNMKYG